MHPKQLAGKTHRHQTLPTRESKVNSPGNGKAIIYAIRGRGYMIYQQVSFEKGH